MVLNGPLSYYDSICYSGPAKWVSKWRGHGTLESIVGHHGWPTKIFFEILDALDALAYPHGLPVLPALLPAITIQMAIQNFIAQRSKLSTK